MTFFSGLVIMTAELDIFFEFPYVEISNITTATTLAKKDFSLTLE